MGHPNTFPVTDQNHVRHGREHADYSRETILKILDAGYLCHLSFILEGLPETIPTLYWRDDEYVYWHGSATSRAITTMAEGGPVCFSVSHLDGFLLGRSAFHHSANYRSVIIKGNPEEVTDPTDKIAGIDAMIENLFPGRRAELRDHRENEMKAVRILRLPIEIVAAKNRYDMSIGGLLDRGQTFSKEEFGEGADNPDCWTGLLPIRQLTLDPVADAQSPNGVTAPEYLGQMRFRQEF